MKRLYFVRHGESELNLRRLFAGSIDTPLTKLGRKQALAASNEIQELDVELIISSPLSRARDTAAIIAEVIDYPLENILVHDLFVEQSFGVIEGTPWDAHDGVEIDFSKVEGAETPEQLRERAAKAYELVRSHPAENILIVGHGSFSNALRQVMNADGKITHTELGNGKVLRLL